MAATARWAEDQAPRPVQAGDIARLWREVESQAARPVVLVFAASGAELHAVVGDATGTVLVYFPSDYARSATGSLHSVGDPVRAARDEGEPPLTAYYFGHHSELPRWCVVSHDVGRRALAEFCKRPQEPPTTITWGPD